MPSASAFVAAYKHIKLHSSGYISKHLITILNGGLQRFFTKIDEKVVSSCLLQYKPVCVTNFDKLRRKMLKISLVVFLV